MTGPRMNHVEARSNKRPARQYVSESHDHKPDAPSRAPLDKDDNRVEEAEANARLIAAAPELLAALKIVREKSYLPTHCAAIIDAALAKAEGGSHA